MRSARLRRRPIERDGRPDFWRGGGQSCAKGQTTSDILRNREEKRWGPLICFLAPPLDLAPMNDEDTQLRR
jgi:hypothetical protein